ncbi:MAG: DUF4357 domain-containing protein [Bacteroidaceae bacterium]|nr:DUF4357 domain-containing protein [Bacteroidaceae bacterium]
MEDKNIKLEELKTKLQDAYNDADLLEMLSLSLPREKAEEIRLLENEYAKEAMDGVVKEIQQQIKKFISSFSIDMTYSHAEKRIVWTPSVNSQKETIRRTQNNEPENIMIPSHPTPEFKHVPDSVASENPGNTSPCKILLRLKSKRIRAYGIYDGEKFILQKGSQAELYCSKIFTGYEKRERMLKSYATHDNEVWTLTFDMELSSPSAASVFCLGRNSNGWMEWVDEQGRTLKEIFSNVSGKYKNSAISYSQEQRRPYQRDVNEQSGRNYIRVVFPDNRVSCSKQVWQTLVDVVNYAGGKNVQRLGIMMLGDNLVTSHLNSNSAYRSAQKLLVDGLYVSTFSTTEVKYKQIQKINRDLNLGLIVQKILS